MTISEQNILTAFSQHPEEGATLLFLQYYKSLMTFSGSFISDNSTCEDIIQNLFYDFIKNKTYRRISPGTLSAYLFRSTRNNCLYYLRGRKPFTDIELLELQAIEEEAMTFSPELVTAIHKAIEQLPEKQRRIITSIIIQKKKYKETAQEMNISVNTVKSQLSDGLKQLRKQFPASLLLFIFSKTRTLSSFSTFLQNHKF